MHCRPCRVDRSLATIGAIFASILVAGLCWQDPVVAAESNRPANAAKGVRYVGTEQCIECHKDQHRSYLQTTHSIATKVTDAETEPGPASFQHPYSGHTYEVDHRDGELLHREIMRGSDGSPRHVTEEVITHSIGSGTHGKSYLYRDGEFWAQSPLSWFKKTGSWEMSPGYERPLHISFRRNVGTGCVFCHVGQIDRKQDNPFAFEIVETAIGCERCHGPGQLHVEKHRAQPQAKGPDDTIVNPASLSRELSEAICQQCHLQGAASAPVSDKSEWDYRPGLPLTDFRVDYQYRLGDDTMKIVGHVEQMHMSECYKQTETLTCITCHDPHNTPSADEMVQHYRSICLDCHQDDACGKPHAQRIELADNNCAVCHMPKADTDVPHTAFHHHRIGIHDAEDKEALEVIAGLTPVLDISNLDEKEQQRCAALAKVQLFREQPGNPAFATYAREGTGQLVQLKAAGKDDAELNAVLAWLAQIQNQSEIANMLAKEVLNKEPDPTRNRIEALRILGQAAFKRGEKEKAVEIYRQIASLHRDPYDTYFLGVCENNVGNTEAAIAALERSLELDPSQVAAHQALQAIYQAQGKSAEAQSHAAAAAENQSLNLRLQQLERELMEQEQKP